MDIPLKCFGSGEIDPTLGSTLLVVSCHMTVSAQSEMGICKSQCAWHTQLSADGKINNNKMLLPSELSVQKSGSYCDMQIKCFSLVEQSFVTFFQVHDKTHLAVSQSFKHNLLLQLISSQRKAQQYLYTCWHASLNLGLVYSRLTKNIMVCSMIDHDRFEGLCSLES